MSENKLSSSRLTFSSPAYPQFSVVSKSDDEVHVIQKLTWHSSVHSFPNGDLDLLMHESVPQLARIRRDDRILIEISQGSSEYQTMFIGEVANQSLSLKKDQNKLLSLKLISPFYKLCFLKLDMDEISGKKFSEILDYLVEIGEIEGKIYLDESVPDVIDIGYINNFPALSFIKMICLQNRLAMVIDKGDSLTIKSIEKMLSQLLVTPPIVINEADIITGEFKQGF
ncbi:hypothetical protein [Leptospira yasudae]|uniref:hypothetical protein n=1 Tax=Leptospira yasudae TaxID=2202201 RepID=UPI0010912FE3|nr:hypothetical protein [Leptospira yasudae]TGM96792.1 hypothetical protein EHR10_15685 [Leptospira yasudae]